MSTMFYLLGAHPAPLLSHLLPGHEYTLGRTADCQIFIPHQTVSREHAHLVVEDSRVRVVDLNSSYGTFVNNRPVKNGELTNGQYLRLGHIEFLVSAAVPPPPPLDPSKATDHNDNQHAEGNGKTEVNKPVKLTPARAEVLELLLEGLSLKAVAKLLDVTRDTVHNHVTAIYETLKVHSHAELVAKYAR